VLATCGRHSHRLVGRQRALTIAVAAVSVHLDNASTSAGQADVSKSLRFRHRKKAPISSTQPVPVGRFLHTRVMAF
jgi:hypothetical protein